MTISGKILFIVNPNSGWHNGGMFRKFIRKLPEYSKIDFDIKITEYAGQASELARMAVEGGGYSVVVAVGGDGTVNEVGSALVGTGIVMGVVPLGRGNGFARHIGCSMRVSNALRQLIHSRVEKVDVMDINGHMSLNVSGIGFDAFIAHLASRTRVKGIFSYIWVALRNFFRYRAHTYKLKIDGKKYEMKAFLLSFANTEQYGGNVIIAPRASIQDGVMEVCVIDRLRNVLLAGLEFAGYLFLEKDTHNRSYRLFHCSEVEVTGKINIIHIDGEPLYINSPILIKVLPRALKVLVPEPDPKGL